MLRDLNKFSVYDRRSIMLPRSVAVVAIILVLVTFPSESQQQQEQPNIQSTIDSVFGTGGGAVANPPPPSSNRNRGFGTVVTPEPFVQPTSQPTVLRKDTANECTCVPYYMCDPSDNTVRGEDPDFDGFGVIDIRFDERACQDVLDVCCKGANQKEEPIVVKPIVQKPNRAAGCGIRNVGGIDFQLAGAVVSAI